MDDVKFSYILNSLYYLNVILHMVIIYNVTHQFVSINDVVDAHCYVVNIRRTDREQIRSRINNN